MFNYFEKSKKMMRFLIFLYKLSNGKEFNNLNLVIDFKCEIFDVII